MHPQPFFQPVIYWAPVSCHSYICSNQCNGNNQNQKVEVVKKEKRKRKYFTPSEDTALRKAVAKIGKHDWQEVSKIVGSRTPRQCRERWELYLDPSISNNGWTHEEDIKLLKIVKRIGRQWTRISSLFKHRTPAALKNRFLVLERRNLKNDRKREYRKKQPEIFEPKKEVVKAANETSSLFDFDGDFNFDIFSEDSIFL